MICKTPAVYIKALWLNSELTTKMHHFKCSRYMLRMEFSRRHFLKVRSTWLRLPVCSCACTISTLLFSCKMILIAMTELLQIPQLEDSRLTSEATDGWLRVHEGPHWHICDVGWLAMPTPLDSDLICPSRFPLCFSQKSACFKFFRFYMLSSLSNHQSASGQSREGSCDMSV